MPSAPAALPDGKIQDFIDGKVRNDTPEEYVRQNIEKRLVRELGYPPDHVAVEFQVKMGSGRKRADIVVFPEGEEHDQDNAWIIIECKKDSVKPSSKQDGVDQLKSYLAACPNAEWGMWTNGRFKAVYRKVSDAAGRVRYEEPNDIPGFGEDPDAVDHPERDDLKCGTGDNLLFSFRTAHDYIHANDGKQKQQAFFELLKVIFCKIHDERNVPNPLQFYATAREKGSRDGQLTVRNRIAGIFAEVKRAYPAIFKPADEIDLLPDSLAFVVGELQRYSFLDTNIDVKGKAYEELVGSNLRGDRGEFFTPRNVQRMTIEMLAPRIDDRILDPSCGTGGFLVIAMNRVLDQLRASYGDRDLSQWEADAVRQKAGKIAADHFFGIDINPDLVKSTKMNMVMNNDGAGNILRQNSLLHPHEWDSGFKQKLASALGVEPSTIRRPEDLGHFDVIATNPPFGSKLPVNDASTLDQYLLARVWEVNDGGLMTPTDQVQSSVAPEVLFIERCWQFLKPGGRMGIVLPNAILGAPGLLYVRHWMLTYSKLVASIDLHPDTFLPSANVRTSVLILQRKTAAEVERGVGDYNVFMAEVRAIGHDKRGNTTYRRNEEGEIIWVDPPANVARMDATAAGAVSARPLGRTKVEDDDTMEVAAEFSEWKRTEVLGW